MSPHEQQALSLLAKLTGKKDAVWSSPLQWEAIHEVILLRNDMLVVMATGSGKTMVALIPTLMDGDVSVIVLPLNSLITDYKRKLEAMDVPYDHYTSSTRSLKQDINIVLVSADLAQTSGWRQAISNLNEAHDVTRLFFDEAHMPLSGQDFRKALNDLHRLRHLEVQFILLSGTVPPQSADFLCNEFGLGSNRIVLRGPTDRPELTYIRLPSLADVDALLPLITKLIKDSLKDNQPESRILVFAATIAIGESIADHLACEFYHGKIKSNGEREGMYKRWWSGETKTLVATSALGAGNDYQHVRTVIHAGAPHEMINFVQEASRGGRDGKPARCYLIPLGQPKTGETVGEDHKGQGAMIEYTWQYPKCLRHVITTFCDGAGVYCFDSPTRELCSACRRANQIKAALPLPLPAAPSGSALWPDLPKVALGKRKAPGKTSAFSAQVQATKRLNQEFETKDIEYVNNFRMSLSFFQTVCAFCSLNGIQARHHSILHCPSMRKHSTTYQTWKKRIVYGKNHCTTCFFCHVPQCHDSLHATFSRGTDCEFPDVIAPIAFGIFTIEHYRTMAQQHFGVEWSSSITFSHWLNGPTIEGEKTNISALFLWYVETVYNIT